MGRKASAASATALLHPQAGAHFLLQPLLGSQVRTGQLFQFSLCGAGRGEVNAAITMCVLGLKTMPQPLKESGEAQDARGGPGYPGKGCGRAAQPQPQSPSHPPFPQGHQGQGVPGPKAALAVIRWGARVPLGVFTRGLPRLLCLLRVGCRTRWSVWPAQELNITTPAAA